MVRQQIEKIVSFYINLYVLIYKIDKNIIYQLSRLNLIPILNKNI